MSDGHYADERITYDRAGEVVEEYVEEVNQKSLVSVRDVCKKMDVENIEHNRHRLHEALRERFSVNERWSSSAKKFEVER